MDMAAKNKPGKIRPGWEEVSCSWLYDGGGLRALAVDEKIIGEERELFWQK